MSTVDEEFSFPTTCMSVLGKICYIFLSIRAAPLNITQSLSDINVLIGQSGTLQITCDAFPAPKVTWYVSESILGAYFIPSSPIFKVLQRHRIEEFFEI